MVRRRVDTDVVIVHDGVSPIDVAQVRRLWRQSTSNETSPTSTTAPRSKPDIRELAHLRTTHTALANAHERVMGFHLLEPVAQEERGAPPPGTNQPVTKPQPTDRRGVGHIPLLPRPNFLSALAEFTLGE
jgi:hypothetical protein